MILNVAKLRQIWVKNDIDSKWVKNWVTAKNEPKLRQNKAKSSNSAKMKQKILNTWVCFHQVQAETKRVGVLTSESAGDLKYGLICSASSLCCSGLHWNFLLILAQDSNQSSQLEKNIFVFSKRNRVLTFIPLKINLKVIQY